MIHRASQPSLEYVEDACRDSFGGLEDWRFPRVLMRTASRSSESCVYKQAVAGVKWMESPTGSRAAEYG